MVAAGFRGIEWRCGPVKGRPDSHGYVRRIKGQRLEESTVPQCGFGCLLVAVPVRGTVGPALRRRARRYKKQSPCSCTILSHYTTHPLEPLSIPILYRPTTFYTTPNHTLHLPSPCVSPPSSSLPPPPAPPTPRLTPSSPPSAASSPPTSARM